MRLPKRSWVRSRGGFSFARRPSSITSAPAADLAELRRAVGGPAAALALERLGEHRSDVKGCSPASGADWLMTSWVVAAGRCSSVDKGGLLSGNRSNTEVSQRGDQRLGVVRAGGGGERADHRLADRADERGGADLGVLRRQLAGVDAVARSRPPSRRGRRGGRRGAPPRSRGRPARRAGPRRAAAPGGPAGRRPRRPPRPSPRHRPARAPRPRRAASTSCCEARPEDLGEEVGLGGEVAVDRPGGDAGALGDSRHLAPRRSRRARSARGPRRRCARASPPCGPRCARSACTPHKK